jgi:hypothetical protein
MILLLSGSIAIHAQEEYFEQYNQDLIRITYEKIYLHTDRNIYSVREDIWFKIYLLDGKTHTPLPGVNTVYVDLVNPLGEVLIHKPVLVENGTGNGNYTIADSVRTGTYTICAYTSYMRNLDIESMFKKEIVISQIHLDDGGQVSTGQADATPIEEQGDPAVLIEFMPEGGYLSAGIPNTLAFKITANNGTGINLKGIITDNNGVIVDSLQGTHLGMGKINFIPRTGIGYNAILDVHPYDTFPLPLAYRIPQLQFVGIKDEIVQFSINSPSVYNKEGVYYFAVKARGQLSFYVQAKIGRGINTLNFHLDNFKPGLNQAVLLDNNFTPRAERLFYIPGAPRADANIQLSRETYKRREKAEVRLQLMSQADISAGGSFSMSVINLDQIGISGIPPENIFSYLELTSEVRGHIEGPGYYFSQPYDSVKEDLDLLLLTQGWTRYIWDDDYISSLPDLEYRQEPGLTVEGYAQSYLGMDLEQGNIILLVPEINLITETTTDSTGYYKFDNMILFDSTKIAVQSRSRINLNNTRLAEVNYPVPLPPVFPEPLRFIPAPDGLEAYNKNAYPRYVSNSYFDYDRSTILIEEVTVVEDRSIEDDGHFRIYGEPTHVIDMDDHSDVGYWDVWTFMQGRVPGLRITDEGVFSNRVGATTDTGGMLIYLDGIESDFEIVSTIPLQDIDKIEVLNDAFSMTAFGMSGANGVISIFTKRGEGASAGLPVFDIIAKTIEGYARTKEFYMPDHENQQTDPAVIDHRATVFWAPNLIPDSTGTCTVSFFNSDDLGRIGIIAEGILNNGTPGVAKAFYRVERE